MVSAKPKMPMAELIKRRFARMQRGDFRPMIAKNCDIVAEDMVDHIERQLAIDDTALPKNEPKTLARKAKLGKGSRSLIWDGMLSDVRMFVKKVEKMRGEISRQTNVTRDDGKVTNYSEVSPGKVFWWFDKYKFWGISVKAQADMLENQTKYIRDQLSGVR